MRISTSMMYTQGTDAMARQQSELLHTQQQISNNRRMLTPADDPVASAQALTVSQAKDQNDQYASNIGTAKSALAFSDSVLAQISEVLQSVRTTAVAGGGGVLGNSDRASLASDVSASLHALMGFANTKDGNGAYMFGGFRTDTPPFVADGSGNVIYNGDQGTRELQVASGRSLPISEAGSTLFEQVKNGNGRVVTAAAAANVGTGVAGAGQVITPAAFNGNSYSLQFHVVAGATTYDVVNTTTATTISSANAYTDGAAINVGGMQLTVTGAPADGDRITAGPSTQQSIFTTLQQLVTTLQSPVTTPADRAKLANGIGRALQDIDQAFGNVLASRTTVGASLSELDSVTSANEDRGLQYAQSLSNLQDLDYTKAISDFTRQQTALEAAQKSFIVISGLSLFKFL